MRVGITELQRCGQVVKKLLSTSAICWWSWLFSKIHELISYFNQSTFTKHFSLSLWIKCYTQVSKLFSVLACTCSRVNEVCRDIIVCNQAHERSVNSKTPPS